MLRAFNREFIDNVVRATHTGTEKWMVNTVPGYSFTVPAERDVETGEPIEYPPSFGPEMLSPIKVKDVGDIAPRHLVALNNQYGPPRFPWVIDGRTADEPLVRITEPSSLDAVPLTAQQREQWQILTTMEVRNGQGRLLAEELDHEVGLPSFAVRSVGPGGGQAARLDEIHREYRNAARLRLLAEDRDLKFMVNQRKMEQAKLKYLPTTDPRSPQFGQGAGDIMKLLPPGMGR
jgi:hypothetical protein